MKKLILLPITVGIILAAGCMGGTQQQFQPVQIPPELTNLVNQITTDLTPIVRAAISNEVYNAVNKKK